MRSVCPAASAVSPSAPSMAESCVFEGNVSSRSISSAFFSAHAFSISETRAVPSAISSFENFVCFAACSEPSGKFSSIVSSSSSAFRFARRTTYRTSRVSYHSRKDERNETHLIWKLG
jgi:hypothetical protein